MGMVLDDEAAWKARGHGCVPRRSRLTRKTLEPADFPRRECGLVRFLAKRSRGSSQGRPVQALERSARSDEGGGRAPRAKHVAGFGAPGAGSVQASGTVLLIRQTCRR